MPLNTGIRHVEIAPEDLHRLRALKTSRVVLIPNHSEGNEPYVLFHLSGLLDEEFNYLAAREVFERYFPAGPLLQAIGCYSITRGAPDRQAYRTTKDLLTSGEHWLVAFPEGIAAGMGDVVMPFEEGIVQIAFSALHDLPAGHDKAPVYLVPLAIKPIYPGAMDRKIDGALTRLEKALLGSLREPTVGFQERLARLSEAILKVNEKMYSIKPLDGATPGERFNTLKEVMLSRIGGAIGLGLRPGQTESDYIRDLFNAIDRIIHTPKAQNRYEEELIGEQRHAARSLYKTLLRVFEFVGFDAGYFDEHPTVERFLDVLGLLEHEVYGRRRFYGPRTALVKVGDPVNLQDYKIRHRDNKKDACREITSLLQSSVQEMLRTLSERSHLLQQEDLKTGIQGR